MRRKSVFVVRLKGSQKRLIESEFGDLRGLRLIGSDKGNDLLGKKARSADIAICFVDFVSHHHINLVKEPSVELHRHEGRHQRLARSSADATTPRGLNVTVKPQTSVTVRRSQQVQLGVNRLDQVAHREHALVRGS